MRKTIISSGRVLCALMLCVRIIMTGCTEGPLEKNENTDQGGSENQGGSGNEDGEGDVVQTDVVTMTLDRVTATTATFTGHLNVPASDLSFSQITVYYSDSEPFNVNTAQSVSTTTFDEQQNFTITLQNLQYGTKYNYSLVAEVKSVKDYSDVADFTTAGVVAQVSVDESSVTATTASFSGTVTGLSEVDKSSIEVGMAYSSVSGELQSNKSIKVSSGEISEEGTCSMSIDELSYDTKYYYCTYVKQNGIYKYGEVKAFVTIDPYVPAIKELNMSSATDLSSSTSANCYIISQSGTYKFKTVKGNSSTSVGDVASCTILWESFGTSTTPDYCSLISAVCYKDNYIAFETSSTFTEGNAVIAAKDADGKILWSWHIWLTDMPAEHVYNNNAGTMMDRNLGATSATPGDVGALGLLYQWGRKDPFLGSSSISDDVDAKSTLSWPSAVGSTSETGTIDYVTANPTTLVTRNSNNYDWYYTGSSSTDNTRWQSEKTIYDPCPPGWRVPDGGSSGVWSKAGFDHTTYDSNNEGISFSISSPSTTWYPASGYRRPLGCWLDYVGYHVRYWSVTPSSVRAYYLYFGDGGSVNPSRFGERASGCAVRCFKEGTGGGSSESEIVAKDLSISGTANSYIVSESGAYKFRSKKGNSTTSVGTVDKAEVLWESFGTDTAPSIGDLVKNVSYKDGYITFEATDKKGNAVIAAKDASGNILWSWHIWLTDQPEGQVYKNNAGTMMDRNLGATSATPGDVGALGLLYQWGRKDPFLGSSSISSSTLAASTLTWPSSVESTSSTGTIDYVTANPTTFVTYNSNNGDWYYTGSSSTDNTRWQSEKTIYDPCPAGWRVPDGGSSGVWSTALGSGSFFKDEELYNSTNEGMNFSGKFGSASTIWYPASGCRNFSDGGLYDVGNFGYYCSVTPYRRSAYSLYFSNFGGVYPSNYYYRANGQSVRCLQESK